MILSALVNFV